MSLSETPVAPRPGDTPEAALDRMRRLLDVCLALGVARDLDALFDTITRTTIRVLRCEAASVLLYDRADDALRFAAATGNGSETLLGVTVPLGGSLAGTIFRENRPLLAVDLATDGGHFATASAQTEVRPETLLGVPMRIDGRVVGVLEALNPLADGDGVAGGAAVFDRADAESLLVIAAQAAVALRAARQQTALEDANARLEALDQTRTQAFTLASHELRTPLTALRGFADVLADEVRPELLHLVDEVRDAGQRMQDVVEAVEEMAWLRTDGVALDLAPVALADVLADVCADASRPVRLHAVDAALTVAADRRRLYAALGHLVRNAVAFTPPDGEVHVAARAEDDGVRVAVADTGCGLAAEHLDRVFAPFFQVQPTDTRAHEGLGVGLSVARAVAAKHGGRLWATSAGPGCGTTFHLRLPRAA